MVLSQGQQPLKHQRAAGKPGRHARPVSKAPFRPRLEALEDRTLLSTFVVDRLTDTGEGSNLSGDLRYCVTQATSAQDTITFGVMGTINLSRPLPTLNRNLIIDGPGAGVLTVRRNSGGNYRIFTVVYGTTILLSGLRITNGEVDNDDGGGIWNAGSLTVSDCTVSSNTTPGGKGAGIFNAGTLTLIHCTLSRNGLLMPGDVKGGGIYNAGTLTVSNCFLTYNGNPSSYPSSYFCFGGGIYNAGGMVSLSDSILSGNGAGGALGLGGYGGGIYNASGTVAVSNCTLTGNSAEGGSGAIYNGGTLTLTNCTVTNNSAMFRAAGGVDNGGMLTVSNCTFTGNSAMLGRGGAIGNGGTLLVSNSTFTSNSAPGAEGGGIFNYGTLTVSNSTFTRNSAAAGGGIRNAGSLTLSNCTLANNTTRTSGGGIDNSGGTLIVRDSILAGNSASITGGGISNSRSATTIVSNSTISGNSAVAGGGIWNAGILTVSNSTISGNAARGAQTAGGIASVGFSDSGATVALLNSTIANNTVTSDDRTGSQLYSGHDSLLPSAGQLRNTIISGDGSKPNFFADMGGRFVSQGHNLSNDNGNGFLTGPGDIIDTDPLLGPLQDNGGPTQTMALLPGSPALDAGDNTAAPDFDQRGPGFPRIVAGTIDIGAFEVQPGPATRFQVSTPAHITSNTPFDVTVTALDAYGHTAVGYLGTVTFGSSDTDPGVLLPADYTFTADDQGVHAFVGAFVLITLGDQALTATDTSDNSITGTATVTVDPGPAPPPGGGGSRPLTPTIATDSTQARSVQPCPEVASVDRLFASVMQQQYPLIFAGLSSTGQG